MAVYGRPLIVLLRPVSGNANECAFPAVAPERRTQVSRPSEFKACRILLDARQTQIGRNRIPFEARNGGACFRAAPLGLPRWPGGGHH